MERIGRGRRRPRISTHARHALKAPLCNGLWLALGFASLLLGGCANTEGPGHTVTRTLSALGLKESRAVSDRQRTVEIALHGARNLNAGRGRDGVAVVVRVYQLRDSARFEQASMARLLDGSDVQDPDVLDVTEHVLLPGDAQQWPIRLSEEARHLGVVALFRHPGDGPWRFVFDGRRAIREGVVIGAHACALTTASPALTTVMSGDPMQLSGTRCGP